MPFICLFHCEILGGLLFLRILCSHRLALEGGNADLVCGLQFVWSFFLFLEEKFSSNNFVTHHVSSSHSLTLKASHSRDSSGQQSTSQLTRPFLKRR